MDWNNVNKNYWNDISNFYDSLYIDSWSKLEDELIQYELCSVVKNSDIVLDLGCGLCLGYDLIAAIYPCIKYIGVDISSNMIEQAKIKNKNINILNSSMSCLNSIADNSIDIVISINTSFSFTDNIYKTISEIKRVLKKNGRVFISVISKWSLRRIFKLKFGNTEDYSTRNIKTNKKSCAWVFSVNELKSIFIENDFEITRIKGYNSFAGIIQVQWVWELNLVVSKLFPNFSHDLILTATLK